MDFGIIQIGDFMKRFNIKRILPIVLIIVIIIAIISIIFSSKEDNNENNADFSIGKTKENIDTGLVTISQNDTATVNEYVDNNGNKLDDNTLKQTKDNIMTSFKRISSDKLGQDIDISRCKIIFNKGTTTIKENSFLVFNVYSQEGKNIGTYAMSIDTNTIYRYNTQTLEYELIEI